MAEFLPVSYEEMLERGWEQPDFVYVCGDAYIDHPSFGAAIICRTLESRGFKVCFLAQPNWRSPDDFRRFGKPRLGFIRWLITIPSLKKDVQKITIHRVLKWASDLIEQSLSIVRWLDKHIRIPILLLVELKLV